MQLSGLGYDEIKDLISEQTGYNRSHLEHPGRKYPSIYAGRQYVTDFETGVIARGSMKIGKTDCPSLICRSRNQAGGDFRIHMLIHCHDSRWAHWFEQFIHESLVSYKDHSKVNQKELYRIRDDEIVPIMQKLLKEYNSNRSNVEFKIILPETIS